MHPKSHHVKWVILSMIIAGFYSCGKKNIHDKMAEQPLMWVEKGHKNQNWSIIKLPRDMTLHELSVITRKSEKVLIKLNRKLKKRAPYKGQGIGLWLTPEETRQITARLAINKIRMEAYPNVREIISYTVKGNESVAYLVKRFHSDARLMEQINGSSKLIVMAKGTKLRIPVLRRKVKSRPKPSGNYETYTVRRGDTAWRIAKKNHINMKRLKKYNPDKNLSKLQAGMILLIPRRPKGH